MTLGPNRRHFLQLGAAAAAATAIGATVPAPALAVPRLSRRQIHLVNTHTQEALETVYWADGQYRLEAMVQVNRFLRDHRTGRMRMMDPELLDQLFALRQRVGAGGPFHIISAYRSPATNAMLAAHSRGVAKRSLHIFGKAVDIRLPGYSTRGLHKAAKDLKAGGVGYYGRSDFIHIDTGAVRYW